MRVLSFLGILGAIILFGLTALLSDQNCYNWGCDCTFDISNKDLYIIASLYFAIFFLIYCVVFMFKITELKGIQKIEISDKILDANLIETNYTVYQLPLVKLLTKVGFFSSIGLIIFAYLVTKIQCHAATGCNTTSCGNDYSYDQEIYVVGFGAIAVYFLMLTLIGLLKSYPSKY